MEGVLSQSVRDSWNKSKIKREELIKEFLKYLMQNEGRDDVNVQLFYARMTGDTDLFKSALDNGADVNMTDTMIIKKYQSEFDEFKKNYRRDD